MFLESVAQATAVFDEEKYSDALPELKRLIKDHWEEIAHYKDIPLDPDYDVYLQIEKSKMMRLYTIRLCSILVGYALFFIKANPHYKSSMQAVQDVLYLRPRYRRGGIGYRFIKWCDKQLAADGCQVVMHHVKAAHDFGPLLNRLGYELTDYVYARRLD